MIELLAPAGNPESLRAAVLNGANAVYLGGTEFSARKYAGNFDRDQMREAVRFCHSYGVKVYVTMNTLLTNEELKRALQYAGFLYETGVDALIIQDLGLLRMLRANIPDFELHASTQMTAHNLDGVNLLYSLGCKRVVLSRELTLKEIKYIADNTKAELEVFIHGALCIGFSGQCLFSSMLGGRSGNRGSCAQPCRKLYSFDGGKMAYNLSTKDLSTRDFIDKIIETGVTSLKIEGRMKRPEYVASVVGVYRRAIDGRAKKDDNRRLLQAFNRGGFTSGYFMGRQGEAMMSRERPKNWGTYLGRVVSTSGKFACIHLEEPLAVHDGVEVFNKGKGAPVGSIKVGGKAVDAARPGEIAEIYLDGAKKGDVIYKTLDAGLIKEAEKSWNPKEAIRVPIYIDFHAHYNSPIYMTVSNGKGISVSCQAEGIEKALKIPTTEENVKAALSKLGDTPFYLEEAVIHMDKDIRISAALLNSMRREAVEKLIDMLQAKRERIELTRGIIPGNIVRTPRIPKVAVLTGSLECAKGAASGGADVIFFGGPDLRTNSGTIWDALKLSNGRTRVLPWYGNIIIEEYEKLKKQAMELKSRGINDAMCGNLGFYKFLRENGFNVYLEKSFNLFNSLACDLLGNEGCILSTELTLRQMKEISAYTESRLMVYVYGRLEAMVNRNCIAGSSMGHGGEGCHDKCGNKAHYLKDNEGEVFPVITDWTCRSHVYNSKILCTIDNIKDIINMYPDYIVLSLLNESEEQSKLVTEACKIEIYNSMEGIKGKNPSLEKLKKLLGDSITKGHIQYGVD